MTSWVIRLEMVLVSVLLIVLMAMAGAPLGMRG